MITRLEIIKEQHELAKKVNQLHNKLRKTEEQKVECLTNLKAYWRSHKLKEIAKYALELNDLKESLKSLQENLVITKAKIKVNKKRISDLGSFSECLRNEQEALNKEKNILKMSTLPKLFKDIEELKQTIPLVVREQDWFYIKILSNRLTCELNEYARKQCDLKRIRCDMRRIRKELDEELKK